MSSSLDIFKRTTARLIDDNIVSPLILSAVFFPFTFLTAANFQTRCLVAIACGTFARVLLGGFLVEAYCFKLYGTTAGKGLLGVRLTKNAQNLSFRDAFRRQRYTLNYTFWTLIGSPLISIIAFPLWCSRLSPNGQTKYDERLGVNYTPESRPVINYIVAGILFPASVFAILAPILVLKRLASNP